MKKYSKPIDQYEKELETFLNKGEFTLSKNQKKIVNEHREAAKNYLARKSITLRVKKDDLISVKKKAQQQGIPYQTLINLLLGQYAKGKIKLAI